MSSPVDKRTLAQRLGLDGFIVGSPTLGTVDLFRQFGSGMLDLEQLEGLDWECPYCGKTVRLVAMDSSHSQDRFYPEPLAIEVEGQSVDWAEFEASRTYFICECPRKSCKGIIFAVLSKHEDGTAKISQAYPYPSVRPDSLPNSIPRKIRDDFAEASRCFYARAYKGVVVLCRRVIQDIAINLREVEQIEVEGDDPADQIKSLRKLGAITKDMFDTGTHITQFGGFGAHPQDDGLDNISPRLAERILGVTMQLLQAIYVMRGENKEFNKAIQQARQKKAP